MKTSNSDSGIANTPITLVIPAFNEENRIAKTIQSILAWSRQSKISDLEILVVDDGSEDNTCACVDRFRQVDAPVRLIKQKHVGRMNAVFGGLKQANFACVGVLDADGAVHPKEFEKLAPYLDRNVIVQGSRILRGDLPPIEGKPFYRRFFSLALSYMFCLLFRVGVRDPQGAGFRLYLTDTISPIIPNLRLKHDGMKDTEIIVRAYGLGIAIKEIPVSYTHDNDSRCVPNLPAQTILVAIFAAIALLQIWFWCGIDYHQGKFKQLPIRGALFFWPAVFFKKSVIP
jgi:dolichyl-phosphate beta-glucosyltransferase